MDRFHGLRRTSVLGYDVPVADTRRSRLLGLALLHRENAGEGLLVPRCRSVHTFGMRFPLDLLFLDERGEVVELHRSVPAGKVFRCPSAGAVLELPSPAL
jgi:uncharacterized membrane protein (UPF0127 family)